MSKQNSAAAVPLERIAATLAPFHRALGEGELRAIQEYLGLLLAWNRVVNLTAIEDPVEILTRHFGESLFAAQVLALRADRVADVGTGAGFPGLALKIVCPDINLTLIESSSRKCAFLTEVIQRLSLSQVDVLRRRYQEVDEKFDVVCSRALGDYPIFLPWAKKALAVGGRVALWVGTDDSVRLCRRKEFEWQAPVPIPESRRRVLLVGRIISSDS